MKVFPRTMPNLRGTSSPSQVAEKFKVIHVLDSPSYAVDLLRCGHPISTSYLQLPGYPKQSPPCSRTPGWGAALPNTCLCHATVAAQRAPAIPHNCFSAVTHKRHAHEGPTLQTSAMTAEANLGVGGKYLLQIPRGVLQSI